MLERERLDDFQGGDVACRRCPALLHFAPDDVTPQQCCGLLYRPEYQPLQLVIYDQLQPGECPDPVRLRPPLPPIPELPPLPPLPELDAPADDGADDAEVPYDEAGDASMLAAMAVTPDETTRRAAKGLLRQGRR